MKTYLMNTSIIPNPGDFRFREASLEEAKKFVLENNWDSAIGHKETAKAMSVLLGVRVPENRIMVKLEKGDMALCFKLASRPEEGKILSYEELLNAGHTWGIIERLQ